MTTDPTPSTEDDAVVLAKLREQGVTIRRSKSGRVLIVDASDGRLHTDDTPCLTGLPRLKELHLCRCAIDDRIADVLTHLIRLQVLDLQHTQISDQIFESVSQLTQLKLLDVTGTRVTLDKVREARKRMINTRIVFLG